MDHLYYTYIFLYGNVKCGLYLPMFNLFAEHKIRKRPRYITILSILLAIFGLSYFFEGIYNSFFLDYISEIILYVNAAAHLSFVVGLLKGKKWALNGTMILSILNLIYSLILIAQVSIIDSILKFVTYGLMLLYVFKPKVKKYFRNSSKSDTLSLHTVPIFSTYKSQPESITIPKGIKHLRRIFLSFSIFYFISFIILIGYFTIQVSEDSQINPDTRRTKNLDFNKTEEYYLYLFDYLSVLGYGLTWIVIYWSMRRNKSWSKTIILILCVIYIAFGKYSLLSYSNDISGTFVAIQTVVAISLLFYFSKSRVEKYYQNITYAK